MKTKIPIPVICFFLTIVVMYIDNKNYHTSSLIAVLVLLAISVFHFIYYRKEFPRGNWFASVVIIVLSLLFFIHQLIKV